MRGPVLALVSITIWAAAGCSAHSGEAGFVAGDGSLSVYQPQQRKDMPALAGKTLDGKALDIASWRGKPVVINVWGSWCGPCRKEAPALERAHQRLKQSAHVVGINSRDTDVSAAQAFVRSFAVSYPNLYDPHGELVLKMAGVSSTAIPTTVWLDKAGKVAAVKLGEVSEATLVGIVDDLNRET